MTSNPHAVAIFMPLIEMQDSLASAEVTAEHAEYCRYSHGDDYWAAEMWQDKSNAHMANAIGWASR